MEPRAIRFLLLEDDKKMFEHYSDIIREIFEEEGVSANQIYPLYSDVASIIKGFNNYLKKRSLTNGHLLPKDLSLKINNDIHPISNDIIYFIDVNWTNKDNNRNGLDFFIDYLGNKNNEKDAIAITVYRIGKEYDGIQHVHKNSNNFKRELRNRISNTNVFKKYLKQRNSEDSDSLPTIVILTALKEEYYAVQEHLVELVEDVKNDTVYEKGIFKFNDRIIAKVIIRECGTKNTVAAQETERAIQYFKPQMLLFVGIAGSRKPTDFSIGDVIFPSEIYSYEAGKSEKNAFMARPDLASTTYTLMELAKKERRKNDWKSLIKNGWKQDIKADLGIIASGEKIVEHYEAEVGKILTKYYNDTSAVEMEGFGFAKVATRQGRETSNILVGVVRGISDIIGQPNGMNNNVTDRRPENTKKLASDTAAAFAFWLIYKTYNLTD